MRRDHALLRPSAATATSNIVQIENEKHRLYWDRAQLRRDHCTSGSCFWHQYPIPAVQSHGQCYAYDRQHLPCAIWYQRMEVCKTAHVSS